MNSRSVALHASLVAALTLPLVPLAGCNNDSASSNAAKQLAALQAQQAKNAGNFSNTVFLGDSLTAGFQSGSLLDITQVHGWAPVLAAQAGFNIVQPLIGYPGAPNVLQLVSLGPPPIIAPVTGTSKGRDNFATQVTDLAVPGALLNDVMNTVPEVNPAPGTQAQLNQLVLGFPGLGYGQANSQATFAVNAQPTTIFLWIGNNDALIADETGMPSSMTSVATFTSQYQALITELTTKAPAHLVIGNIPDVTKVPYLTPAALVLGEVSAETGLPTAVLSQVLGIVPGDLVNPTGTAEIPLILTGHQQGPISDSGVLSAAEIVTVQTQVAAFNQVIAAQAKAANATLVDINALFNQAFTNGVTINGYTGTSSFLGGIFALDGIHPTNVGYAVVANTFIDTMNTAISTKIPDVPLGPVAATDPFWPPNLATQVAPAARPRIMPANAGKAIAPILGKK
ncbi:SGNH/GDSL hydrolase family protein [Tunturibacter empetritectus]|uniref:Lysophospholipase L1-like esterase n=1 Tax=Tunturiibacter empetritectus TaxID=3069691 RepID=A0A7W8IJG1_9BACT|nr:SGNH/GDSL hydrolase family protein [Edaphobacter lichenicola]MBB5317541.1 lysophospholipase L1-like esterase [Edaphobacter lichenicola]